MKQSFRRLVIASALMAVLFGCAKNNALDEPQAEENISLPALEKSYLFIGALNSSDVLKQESANKKTTRVAVGMRDNISRNVFRYYLYETNGNGQKTKEGFIASKEPIGSIDLHGLSFKHNEVVYVKPSTLSSQVSIASKIVFRTKPPQLIHRQDAALTDSVENGLQEAQDLSSGPSRK
ncbi:hypothetical protein LZZ85_12905 [Terrimonas sp. NA20]|uniref:Lipoprotein n=1 Tax=Terrimonas ginsenosidimutans TaxID=2908004 RepID=A0ABS9KS87_9BACT|nr:hypothetical protein [Terrimonas ginsenosidimutans]MCG2615192.1 hypothetical protein [Terrimonas ginsenosidimutans]